MLLWVIWAVIMGLTWMAAPTLAADPDALIKEIHTYTTEADKARRYGRPDEAVRKFGSAVSRYRDLVILVPDTYDRQLATTLYLLGLTYADMKKYVYAAQAHSEALETLRAVQTAGGQDVRADISRTLVGLADVNSRRGLYEDADALLTEALAVDRTLTAEDPAHGTAMAGTLFRYGVLDLQRRKPDAAREKLQEAAELQRPAARERPLALGDRLASTMYYLWMASAQLDTPRDERCAYLEEGQGAARGASLRSAVARAFAKDCVGG